MNAHMDTPFDLTLLVPKGAHGPRIDRKLEVTLGEEHQVLGELHHYVSAQGECSQFTYSRQWLDRKHSVNISPDLRLIRSSQWRKASGTTGSPFFGSLADTQPTGFASHVMQRVVDRGLINTAAETSSKINHLDRLCIVHDHCRLGALRVRPSGTPRTNNAANQLLLPRDSDLQQMLSAISAFESGTEDDRQLMLLLYGATSLGGDRPKCSFRQDDGTLALVKFPSVFDVHPVTRAEVLATYLARAAGIHAVEAKLMLLMYAPAVVVRRFDRESGKRRPYMSAASLVQTQHDDELDYRELLLVMRMCCKSFWSEARALWRRLLFNLLINNTEVGLRKIGFLYCGSHQWTLAPAHDLTPCISAPATLAPWKNPTQTVIHQVDQLVSAAGDFELSPAESL
jgi:serine/threonine-protein kinase HipA